jgi:hypothetical protein
MDNLQEIVDEMRRELRTEGSGYWEILDDRLDGSLYVEVRPAPQDPDGRRMVVVQSMYLDDVSDDVAMPFDTLVCDLYVIVRRLVRAALGDPTLRAS